MFVHLGKSESVRENDVVGFFDMDAATVSPITRDFLKKMQSEMKTVNLCADIPQSFVLTDNEYTESVYITQFAATTLAERANRVNERERK